MLCICNACSIFHRYLKNEISLCPSIRTSPKHKTLHMKQNIIKYLPNVHVAGHIFIYWHMVFISWRKYGFDSQWNLVQLQKWEGVSEIYINTCVKGYRLSIYSLLWYSDNRVSTGGGWIINGLHAQHGKCFDRKVPACTYSQHQTTSSNDLWTRFEHFNIR